MADAGTNAGKSSRGWWCGGLRLALWVVVTLVLLVATLWATAALYYDVRISWLRFPLAILYPLGLLAAVIFLKPRRRAAVIAAASFALVYFWWLTLQPARNRDWLPDVAQLARADVNGNKVTIHNIRNCDYRTETDFDVRYYDKTFDLDQLQATDLFMVYWGSPAMAHTMLSFGFTDGSQVCFSIETRKEQGEGYSAVKGLFRQFELIYIVGDERDLVRLRTNYRKGEEAYLYRLRGTPEQTRNFFLSYLRRVNELHERPEWYNAVTENCTSGIRAQRAASDRAPWDWRMLVNGYGNELLYERGAIYTNVPLAELVPQSHINERARAADKAEDFSRQIRVGIPGINP